MRCSYIASFRGPILLSAPHSARICRGGQLTKTRERIHLREQYVSTLVLKIAAEIEKIQRENNLNASKIIQTSVLIWNKDKKFDKFCLDPNYLVR